MCNWSYHEPLGTSVGAFPARRFTNSTTSQDFSWRLDFSICTRPSTARIILVHVSDRSWTCVGVNPASKTHSVLRAPGAIPTAFPIHSTVQDMEASTSYVQSSVTGGKDVQDGLSPRIMGYSRNSTDTDETSLAGNGKDSGNFSSPVRCEHDRHVVGCCWTMKRWRILRSIRNNIHMSLLNGVHTYKLS